MSTNERPARPEIDMLHYGRGAAALLVCLFHSQGLIEKYFGGMPWGNLFQAGHSGVEFFFILSGFIILHAHRQDIGRPEKIRPFLLKRAIRILPLFWLVTLPLGVLFLAAPMLGADRELIPGKLLTDMLLIPREGTLTLPPAWTLQHEAVFYLMFAVALVSRKAGVLTLGLWQAVCIIVMVFSLTDPNYRLPLNKLIGFHNLGFGIGMLIALLYASRYFATVRPLLPKCGAWAAIPLLAMFAGEWIGGPDLFGGAAALALSYFAIYAVLILALLAMRPRPRPALDATFGVLGSASYALYITHEPVGSIVNKLLINPVLQPFVGPVMAYAVIVGACLLTGLAFHFAIERPAIDWLKRRLLSRQRLRPALA
jgi:exopolysaccharide production protein ExoZ